ncbi:MAG: putative oxidoreductase oxidoreductase protein [Pseudonocardiales bacterium]|nr:putative oxidoreductase oxidoreductase protein [Pseudonocardiales bacterium]
MTDVLAGHTVTVSLTVNGTAHEVEIEPRELLVTVLRERLRLTGTNIGCETTSCGACTVLLDGRSVKSCTVLAVQVHGRDITTIEGLAGPDGLHPVQEAFRRCHGLQCGFCTPGMVMAAVSLIDEGRATDEKSVRLALKGNLCRCTGYHNIVQSVLSAAEVMKEADA